MRGTENLNAIGIGKGANDGRVSNLKRFMHNFPLKIIFYTLFLLVAFDSLFHYLR